MTVMTMTTKKTRPKSPWYVGPLTSESSPLKGIVLVSIHQIFRIVMGCGIACFSQRIMPSEELKTCATRWRWCQIINVYSKFSTMQQRKSETKVIFLFLPVLTKPLHHL